MGKLVLGNLIRHLLTLLIGFFVARHLLSADVAHKLNAGDTVELWGGTWTVNVKQVSDFIQAAILPALLPILWGAWVRVRDTYKVLVARLNPNSMTAGEVKKAVAEATPAQIIKTIHAADPT